MATMMNTVAKDPISPSKVMTLPFIDVDVDSIIIPISSEKQARELLKEIRGF